MSHRNLLLLLGALVVSYACYVRAEQNPYARYVRTGAPFVRGAFILSGCAARLSRVADRP